MAIRRCLFRNDAPRRTQSSFNKRIKTSVLLCVLCGETNKDTPMNQDNNQEMFPLVDEEGNITGAATRGECHNGSKLLHPVVHLHVFNSRGELYLQKRPDWKDIQPGKWDTAVGGHVDLGESVEMALRREVREELGITDFTPYDGPVCPSDELDGGRFWSLDEIRANMGKGLFTPNFEGEIEKVVPLES